MSPLETETYPDFEQNLLQLKGILARLWLAAPTYNALQIEEAITKLAPCAAALKGRNWFIHDRPDLALLEKIITALDMQTDEYLRLLCSPDAFARGEAIAAAIPMFTALSTDNSKLQ
jgi:hypothetical protein